jgi:hypothetical protein
MVIFYVQMTILLLLIERHLQEYKNSHYILKIKLFCPQITLLYCPYVPIEGARTWLARLRLCRLPELKPFLSNHGGSS